MWGKICTTWMWLIGTALFLLGAGLWPVAGWAAGAADWMAAPEELTYDLSFGPVGVGRAQLTYTPGAKGAYTLAARVKSSTLFFDMNDSWTVTGRYDGAKQGFEPGMLHAVQAENSYRADKTLTFDRKAGVVRYANLRRAEDTYTVPLTEGLKDVFSILYGLRAQGVAVLGQARMVEVMGTKRPFPLSIGAAVADPLSDAKTALRVDMSAYNAPKNRTDRWSIWVVPQADGSLVPVRIAAALKFGSFTAELRR